MGEGWVGGCARTRDGAHSGSRGRISTRGWRRKEGWVGGVGEYRGWGAFGFAGGGSRREGGGGKRDGLAD